MAPENNRRSYICPSCGGGIRYDISRRRLCCASCGREADFPLNQTPVREHPYNNGQISSANARPAAETVTVRCSGCGAEICFAGNQTATVCPMCGSAQIAEARQTAGIAPDGLIPFKIDQYQAQELFHKWVRSRWFAPGALKRSYQEGRLTPVYLPYWTFDAQASATFHGRGGRITHVRRGNKTYTTTTWYPVNGTVRQSFDDVQICASANQQKKLAGEIQPFGTTHNCLSYDPAYLAGAQAEHYAKPLPEAYRDACGRMEAELSAQAQSQILSRGFQQATVTSLNPAYNNVTYKQVLLPVWLAAFNLRGKAYHYAINGETGRVCGQRPYSAPKIALAVLAVLLAAALFLLVFSDQAYGAERTPRAEPTHISQTAQTLETIPPIQGDDI